jgi:tRNA(fMet)-specific endonuclease VapC
MARYLIDTTTLIDFSKRIEPVAARLLAMLRAKEVIGVCDVVVAEFFTGVLPAERETWHTFIGSLHYWDTPFEVAMRAGEERYALARQGIQISITDAMIAATARAHGAIVITDNTRHFPMPDVTTISLR